MPNHPTPNSPTPSDPVAGNRSSGDPLKLVRRLLYAALALLYLLHNDLWLWHDGRLVAGLLPVSLAYHLLFCLAASALMALLARWAWPVDDRE